MSSNRVPVDYHVPSFPSLYDPVRARTSGNGEAYYLYYTSDIWRFTLYWTLILFGGVHLAAAACAVVMQWRNWRVVWPTPLVFGVVGGLEALLAGSVVGLVLQVLIYKSSLGAVYEAGNFMMSTWIPLIWAGVNVLVLILSSFPTQGGL